MFTVIVGFDWSGNSSTCRPLARRYSVMPSTLVIFETPAIAVGVPFGRDAPGSLRWGRWIPACAGMTLLGAGVTLVAPSPFVAGVSGLPFGGAGGTDSGGAFCGAPGAATGGDAGGSGA